jgi:hypothetical protein
MSNFTWRVFLTFMLIVAIPFQAIASTRMLVCGPSHHRMFVPASQPEAVSETTHHHATPVIDHARTHARTHDHTNNHDHTSVHAPSTSPAFSEVPTEDSSTLTSVHQSAQSKCNSCAPCCTASALVSEFSVHLDNSALNSDFPAVPPLHWPSRIGSLDRPPRSICA